MFILQGINLVELQKALSSPRLGTYHNLLATPELGPAIGGYFWNLELASALAPLLGTLEVALRNAVHHAATSHFARPDWFGLALRHAGDKHWITTTTNNPSIVDIYYRPTAAVFNKKRRFVAGQSKTLKRWYSPSEKKLTETTDRLTKRGVAPVPDQIVANTMFGFWLDLFHDSFEDSTSTNALWPHCAMAAFPYSPIPDRSVMKLKLQSVKDFRNRFSHHEPIWKFRHGATPQIAENDLNNHLSVLLEIIAAVSPQLVSAFERTGVLKRVRWLCSEKTLNAFAAAAPPKQIDHRKVAREVKHKLKKSRADSTLVGVLKPTKAISLHDSGKPIAILTPIQ